MIKGDIVKNKFTSSSYQYLMVVSIDGMGVNVLDYMGNKHRFDKNSAKEAFTVVSHLKEYDEFLNALKKLKDMN